MRGFGIGSFETNPSIGIDDYTVELGQQTPDATAARSEERQSEGGHTEDSCHSEQSSVIPSFFIIPPRETSDESVRQRRNQHQRLGEREGTDDRNLSPTSSTASNHTYFRPYRRDEIVNEIDAANQRGGEGHAAVLKALKNAGVLIFIIDSKVSGSISEIMDSVRNVIFHSCRVQKINSSGKQLKSDVAEKQSDAQSHQKEESTQKVICDVFTQNQRCLLYRDPDGRLFNLTMASHTTAIAAQWEGLQKSFSVVQAVSLLVILMRSFSCPTADGDDAQEDFRPAYLTLILGLVFSEELSISWTNVAMCVRGLPSISAYEIITQVESDWLQKTVLLCLGMASFATGTAQKACSLTGISLACCILLANLGSRSWKFLGWKPTLAGDTCANGFPCAFALGMWEPVMSYILAMATGICFPYLGHRQIEAGGTAAMESVLRIALGVAAAFFISDYDEVQKVLVVGSQNCTQDYVNISVGIWWCVSLVACLLILSKKQPAAEFLPDYKEPLLIKDEASPIGFKVPHLPDFPIDPIYGATGSQCFGMRTCLLGGVLVAAGIGSVFIFLGFSDIGDEYLGNGL